jgi:hypothetical protein
MKSRVFFVAAQYANVKIIAITAASMAIISSQAETLLKKTRLSPMRNNKKTIETTSTEDK